MTRDLIPPAEPEREPDAALRKLVDAITRWRGPMRDDYTLCKAANGALDDLIAAMQEARRYRTVRWLLSAGPEASMHMPLLVPEDQIDAWLDQYTSQNEKTP